MREDIEAAIDAALDDIIGALTRPLTPMEASPRTREVEDPPRIIFKGDFDEFNIFFYRRGWGDGLPLKPPTEKAVEEMLTGTDLPPDYVIGELIPPQREGDHRKDRRERGDGRCLTDLHAHPHRRHAGHPGSGLQFRDLGRQHRFLGAFLDRQRAHRGRPEHYLRHRRPEPR